ncbi:MAG: TetR/AcrR family transcriptional regulator [Myxococcales bacterium]|nr:TetR/AcrR family transcriptional regulator [Myxococcales bacterium]
MRYPPGHRAETRAKLVREGGALAKREGFARSGVDDLARVAGMTSGAFYRHFAGKDELLAAIVEAELATTRARFAAIETNEQLLFALDAYLSMTHVRNPEIGCVLPTLAAEIGRSSTETRGVFERALAEVTDVLADKVGDRAVASAVLTQCVGAVMVARGLESEAARRAVLAAARKSARALLRAGNLA